jgi:hypothetical protein
VVFSSSVISSPPVFYVVPISNDGGDMPYSTVLPGGSPYVLPPRHQTLDLMPPAQEGGPTYPYDGGPQDPVPVPKKTAPAPMKVTPGTKVVSMPQREKLSYPAYGESLRRTSFAVDRQTIPVKADVVRKDAR